VQELLASAPWVLPVVLLLVGLLVGSFLNVVAYRLPLMMEAAWREEAREMLALPAPEPAPTLTLARPGSHCPGCKAPVKPWQNIPVISYLALGGKCGNCGIAIPPRYPVVEAVTGLLTLALAWHFEPGVALLGAMLFTWALVALTLIDMDHQLLPDSITLPLLWLGLALNLGHGYAPIGDAVAGAIAGYGVLWSVYWVFRLATGKEGMGRGDFKLLAALGAWMGWQWLHLIIIMSSVVGAICGIALMLLRSRGKEVPIPFGPYLAAAGWITFLWGEELLALMPFFDIWV
jgi:leader peptidase (prepilin peptidase)/N-methyltransferase